MEYQVVRRVMMLAGALQFTGITAEPIPGRDDRGEGGERTPRPIAAASQDDTQAV